MGEYVEFDTDAGPVLIEVRRSDSGPVTRGGRPADQLTEASENLEQVMARVGPAVRGMVNSLRSASGSPQHVEIEFSVTLSADAKVIIASAKAEANFRVLLKWTEERHG